MEGRLWRGDYGGVTIYGGETMEALDYGGATMEG